MAGNPPQNTYPTTRGRLVHVYEGHSRTAAASVNSWVPYYRALSPRANGADTYNFAVSGNLIADVVARYVASVYPLRPRTADDESWVKLQIGHNDIAAGRTASATWTDIAAFLDTARADGFRVHLMTETPSIFASVAGLNALMLADTSRYDRLSRWDLFFPDYNDATLYDPDKTHYTAAGALLAAKLVVASDVLPSAFNGEHVLRGGLAMPDGWLRVGRTAGRDGVGTILQAIGTSGTIADAGKDQTTNKEGGFIRLMGGADAGTVRGYFGISHTSGGADTIFGSEPLDAVCLRANGSLVLGGGSTIGIQCAANAVGFLGTAPAAQQTGGAATAGGTYDATAQGMLQKAYNALRTFGLLS